MKERSALVIALVLINLTACEDLPENRTVIKQDSLKTTAPFSLRELPQSGLSAKITIGSNETTHSGADYPDGIWQIPIILEAGKEYDLAISWSYGEILVMEESATFLADVDDLNIQPDLEFVNTGYQRFDLDCDGLSNLDELIEGTDPLTTADSGLIVCAGQPDLNVKGDVQYELYSTINYDEFGQEFAGRLVSKFEHDLQIRTDSLNHISYYDVILYSDPIDLDESILIELRNDPELGQTATLLTTLATSSQASSTPGSACIDAFDQSGARCTIPYSWQLDTWYTLTIEKDTADGDTWTGRIRNHSSNATVEIGSIVSVPELKWRMPAIRIGYYGNPIDNCTQSPSPLKIHFKSALINSTTSANITNTFFGNCLLRSGDWNFSSKKSQTETLFSLSIGDAD